MEEQLAVVLQKLYAQNIWVRESLIIIGKYSFESLVEWLSWRKSNSSDCSFWILVYMKSLIEFFLVGPTNLLSKITKKLLLGYPGGSYGMREARFGV